MPDFAPLQHDKHPGLFVLHGILADAIDEAFDLGADIFDDAFGILEAFFEHEGGVSALQFADGLNLLSGIFFFVDAEVIFELFYGDFEIEPLVVGHFAHAGLGFIEGFGGGVDFDLLDIAGAHEEGN